VQSRLAAASATAASAALTLLAFILPFETRAPLFSLGPVGVTSVELALYVALALWVGSRVYGAPGSWTAAHGCAVGWAAAVLVSAGAAEYERAAALKFALRSLSGVALFFAVADQASASRRGRHLVPAVAAGAVVAALAALAEMTVPAAARALLAFKPATFQAGGALRASGSFAYPTIAAAYLEAALPLLVVWAAGRELRRRLLSAVGTLLMLEAIVLTGSRAGMAVALVVLLGLTLADARGRLGLRGLAALGAVSLVGLAGADLALRPGGAERMRFRGDGAWYRAEFRPSVSSLEIGAGETTVLPLRLRNRGAIDWAAGGDAAVFVGYEWLDMGRAGALQGASFPVGQALKRGEEATLAIPVQAPGVPGTYQLRWQLGGVGVTWAGSATDALGEVAVRVTSRQSSRAGTDAGKAPQPLQTQLTRFELWRAGWSLWRERPIVGVGPDNFRRLYARSLGPRPLDDRIRANSLYVETLADLGLLGAGAFVGLVVALVSLVRRRWRAADDVLSRSRLVGVAAGFAAFLVHGFVDEFLAFTPTLGLFWLLAGLLAARDEGGQQDPAR
jgi:hypothetical protein